MSENRLDLAKSIFDKIEELGIGPAAAYFKRTEATIKKWAGNTLQPDLAAAQRILDDALNAGTIEIPVFAAPPPQNENKTDRPEAQPAKPTAISDGNPDEKLKLLEPQKEMKKAKKFSILCPINREMSYAVVLSILGNWKSTLPHEIRGMLAQVDFEPDTMIHRSRNILATRFLASNNEWSFWFDSDIIAPIGNPGWFKRRTGAKYDDKWFAQSALEKLTARGKMLIGAVYPERHNGGKIITQPGLSPTGEGDKKEMEDVKNKGPQDRLLQVGWLGFGCVAVHRKVFEDILKTQPEVAGEGDKPHGFFTSLENGPQGEDVAFCKRALKAGHTSFLDLSVFCAHVGKHAYVP